MPHKGDPAGYLPSVQRARKRKKIGLGSLSTTEHQMMGQHDTPQGKAKPRIAMNSRRKAARRRAFLGY